MLLENRNKNLTNLHKAADYLSRSLRENFKVFTVDSRGAKVQFLSENENIITCSYKVKDSVLVLEDLKTDNVKNYLSIQRIDGIVSKGIEDFVSDLRESRFDKADTSFSNILSLFESRNDLDSLRYKFEKHSSAFENNTTIVESGEFRKIQEAKEALKTFIAENREALLKNKDLKDSAGIVNAMSTVFASTVDLTLENVNNAKKLEIDLKEGNNLYEMVCKQELMRQELIESKENFSGVWSTNKAIQELASCIFSDDKTLVETMGRVIEEVPYFSFATKADLNETLTSIYEVNTTDTILKKDVKEFVSKVYETKKPVKEKLINLLSEKYGVNVANLKFVPTFSNLSKTHSVFFEVLSLCMEEGILQDVTKDFAKFVSNKGGVEVLDVNDMIRECLNADDSNLTENAILVNYIDVPRLTQDLSQVIDVLGALTGGAEAGGGMEGEEGLEDEMVPDEELEPGEEELVPGEEELVPGEEEMPPGEEEMPPGEEGLPPEEGEEEIGDAMPGEEGEEAMAAPEEEGEIVGDDSDSSVGLASSGGDVTSIMADLEAILATLGGGEEEEEDPLAVPDDQYGA
tara:strand:+ start:56 stop:1780 length:1725 start_codon:yes stop_codon:yes gene_type:complete